MSSSSDCVFCKIILGAIPAPRLYEDDEFICIRDIQPHARIHLLVIPKKHVASLDSAFPEGGPKETEMLGKLFEVGTWVARREGLLPDGFRSIINTHMAAGQTVFHLHLHLLGGETLGLKLN